MVNGTISGPAIIFDCSGVVPEIKTFHVLVIHPQPDVVGVVHTLPGSGIKRISPCYRNARQRLERKQHRFHHRVVITIAGKYFSVVEEIDLFFCGILTKSKSRPLGAQTCAAPKDQDRRYDDCAHGHQYLNTLPPTITSCVASSNVAFIPVCEAAVVMMHAMVCE